MATVAGHTFIETANGEICESCGRRWVDISGTHETDIGQPNIAHSGNLNRPEYLEIRAKVEKYWNALVGVASGR